MSGQVHLGLDVGGTASRWVACHPNGLVLARGQAAGATGHVFNPAEQARLAAVLTTIAEALARENLVPTTVTAGITGYGSVVSAEVSALVHQVLGVSAENIILIDDIVLAYMTHFEPGEGHLISAGTGSIGVHVATDGSTVRVGGRGILIDDAGAGSWIALRALDRIYRIFDRHGSFHGAERLAHHLFALIGGAEWHHVRQFVYAGDRGRIGSLAVAVSRAATEGDETALAILREAGGELAQLASALLARAGQHPVKFVGGVLDLHPIILEEITRFLKGSDVTRAIGDAALAAAELQGSKRRAWEILLKTSWRPV